MEGETRVEAGDDRGKAEEDEVATARVAAVDAFCLARSTLCRMAAKSQLRGGG